MSNPTQQEMIILFKNNLNYVNSYSKIGAVLARKAVRNERIDTIIDNVVETTNTAGDDDVVVVGSKKEEYIVPFSKFHNRYMVDKPLNDTFQEYKACGKCLAYQYSGESFQFESPWNELMLVQDGDYLATPDDSFSEVYRIEQQAFLETYVISE